MIVVDTNLLIYAINQDSPDHAACKRWLENQLSSAHVGLPWLVVTGFVRITTNPRVLERPLSVERALAYVEEWLALPNVIVAEPGQQHWSVLSRLLLRAGAAGNLTSDAHLAAIAIEHAALLCSADNDFKRFQGVQHFNPLDEDHVREPQLSYA